MSFFEMFECQTRPQLLLARLIPSLQHHNDQTARAGGFLLAFGSPSAPQRRFTELNDNNLSRFAQQNKNIFTLKFPFWLPFKRAESAKFESENADLL